MQDYSLPESVKRKLYECRKLMDSLALCGQTLSLLANKYGSFADLYVPCFKLMSQFKDLSFHSREASLQKKFEEQNTKFLSILGDLSTHYKYYLSTGMSSFVVSDDSLRPHHVVDCLNLLKTAAYNEKKRSTVSRAFSTPLTRDHQMLGVAERISYKEFEEKVDWLLQILQRLARRHAFIIDGMLIALDILSKNPAGAPTRPSLEILTCGTDVSVCHLWLKPQLQKRFEFRRQQVASLCQYTAEAGPFRQLLNYYRGWYEVLKTKESEPRIRAQLVKPENTKLCALFSRNFNTPFILFNREIVDLTSQLDKEEQVSSNATWRELLNRILALENRIEEEVQVLRAAYVFLRCYEFSSDYLYPMMRQLHEGLFFFKSPAWPLPTVPPTVEPPCVFEQISEKDSIVVRNRGYSVESVGGNYELSATPRTPPLPVVVAPMPPHTVPTIPSLVLPNLSVRKQAEYALNCFGCKKSFSTPRRSVLMKCHCQVCGQAFCSACSNERRFTLPRALIHGPVFARVAYFSSPSPDSSYVCAEFFPLPLKHSPFLGIETCDPCAVDTRRRLGILED